MWPVVLLEAVVCEWMAAMEIILASRRRIGWRRMHADLSPTWEYFEAGGEHLCSQIGASEGGIDNEHLLVCVQAACWRDAICTRLNGRRVHEACCWGRRWRRSWRWSPEI